jgi:hypothetical protein
MNASRRTCGFQTKDPRMGSGAGSRRAIVGPNDRRSRVTDHRAKWCVNINGDRVRSARGQGVLNVRTV